MPPSPQDWTRLGLEQLGRGEHAEAAESFRRAVAADPGQAPTWGGLGKCSADLGRLDDAAAAFAEAVWRSPADPWAWSNLATTLHLAGRLSEARVAHREAAARAPAWHPVHDNALLFLHYDPGVTPADLAAAHAAWGRAVPAAPPQSHANSRDPGRPLRVGFVSPDLREHPVARFLEPLLAGLDPTTVVPVLYSEHPRPDATTARLRQHAREWRETAGRSGEAVAAQVRADAIDVLIDLAGHTGHHRLDAFAFRPAPVQASYLGYPYPTGFPAVPYWIADGVLAPPGEPLPGELLRLPGHFAAFRPPDDAPAVAPPPAERTGGVTFAACHSPKKINDAVLGLWKRVLDAVPGSRLLCLWSSFTPPAAAALRGRLAAAGIDPARAEVRRVPPSPAGYLPHLADADIALDPTPFSGHTMACEVLWMGVPVVARRGDRPSGRLAASALAALGLADLIADTDDEYAAAAARLAGDVARRRELRDGLRPLMRERLCDGRAFAERFAAALRAVWREWCDRNR